MTFYTKIKGAALALGLAVAGSAAIASPVNFKIDGAASSVSITQSATGVFCSITNCGVSAALAPGLGTTSFTLDEGESTDFDFLRFTGRGFGASTYDVSATLAFLAPGGSVSSDGGGAAGLFRGRIVAGVLLWDDVPELVTLGDGTSFEVDFEGGIALLEGRRVITGASVELLSGPGPVGGPSEIPLPASAVLLLAGLGGLGAMRMRRKAG